MSSKIVVIQPNGAVTDAYPAGKRWTLKELQDLVGGYIGHRALSDHRVALFDEDGEMRGLPFNSSGSMIAGVALVGVVAIAPAFVLG